MQKRLSLVETVSAQTGKKWRAAALAVLLSCLMIACSAPAANTSGTTGAGADDAAQGAQGDAHDGAGATAPALPDLPPVDLGEGERLRVVATTNLVGDAVARVGGDRIDLTTLLPVGVDPHTYTATPQDLRQLNDAHLIFINGLGLEESLATELDSLDNDAPVVSVNTHVETIEFGQTDAEHEDQGSGEAPDDEEHDDQELNDEEHDEEEEHAHDGADPHTWFRVENVQVWVDTIAETLSTMDPARAEGYAAAAAAYREELTVLAADLQAQIDTLPASNRRLVTDHDALRYFAHTFDFQVVGAVIPAYSTMAAPSAQELAALQETIREAGVPAIFVGATVNPDLANQIAQDLDIRVVPLYTGSLSERDGPAPDYPAFMRHNVDAIVAALQL